MQCYPSPRPRSSINQTPAVLASLLLSFPLLLLAHAAPQPEPVKSTTLSRTMPPLDVGSLVSSHDGGAELKAACGCETAAASTEYCDDPYAPAESLRLRIGEDIDWSDVGAAVAVVLERGDSTKGAAANPKCAARRSAARSSLLSAPRAVAVVIGGLLPAGAGKAARDHGRRRSPCHQLPLGLGGRARVFAAGEAAAARRHQPEPGSPKVSCLGAVRSQPRTAAEGEGITSIGRRWSAWLVADVMFCCWNGRRHRRPAASEAE